MDVSRRYSSREMSKHFGQPKAVRRQTSAINELDAETSGIRQMTGKHLIFALHGEFHGIDVLKNREIIRSPPITTVPHIVGMAAVKIRLDPDGLVAAGGSKKAGVFASAFAVGSVN